MKYRPVTKAIDALKGAQHLIRNLGGQHDDLLDLIDAGLTDLTNCPDCGATEDKMLVLGFACEHEKCPMFQSPAVKNVRG
jgi:hypothetical protein